MQSPIADLKLQAEFMDVAEVLQWERHNGQRQIADLAHYFPGYTNAVFNYGAADYPPYFTADWKGYHILFILGIQSFDQGLRVWADFNQLNLSNRSQAAKFNTPKYAELAVTLIMQNVSPQPNDGHGWIVGGHSWGGILSTLFIVKLLERNRFITEVWHLTAESPIAFPGNLYQRLVAADGDARYNLVRYFNAGDIVPSLPPRRLVLNVSKPIVYDLTANATFLALINPLLAGLAIGTVTTYTVSPPGQVSSDSKVTLFGRSGIVLSIRPGRYDVDTMVETLANAGLTTATTTLFIFQVISGFPVPPAWKMKLDELRYNKLACDSWRNWEPGYLLQVPPKAMSLCWQEDTAGDTDLLLALEFLKPDQDRGSVHQMQEVINRLTFNMQEIVKSPSAGIPADEVTNLSKLIAASPIVTPEDRSAGPVLPLAVLDLAVKVPIYTAIIPVTGLRYNNGEDMGIRPARKAKVKQNVHTGAFEIEWMGRTIGSHPNLSQAKTFAKHWNSVLGFAGNVASFDLTNFPASLTEYLSSM